MTIIALAGDAGVGKDTFANVLIKDHDYTRVALADPLRWLCSKTFKLNYDLFSDNDKKDEELPDGQLALDFHHIDKIRELISSEWGYEVSYKIREEMEEYEGEEFDTPREILRFVGTKLMRNLVSNDIWIELAIDKIRKTGGNIIITDCRFENERDTFRRFGALMILIKKELEAEDEGEHDLGDEDDYDVVFSNNGTLHEFKSNVNMWYTIRKNELSLYKVFKYE